MTAKDEGHTLVEVLVTGGAGFIGSNFVRWALATHPDWRVTTLDKLTYAGRFENLRDALSSDRHLFVKGDVADAAVAGPLVKSADVVVHFAAETPVDRSIQAAGQFIHTAVVGTFVLLEAAFLRSDFSFALVAEGSSTDTPTFYKVSAMWDTQDGSLLLWAFLLTLFSSAVLFVTRRSLREISAEIAGQAGVDPQAFTKACAPIARRLIAMGFLV